MKTRSWKSHSKPAPTIFGLTSPGQFEAVHKALEGRNIRAESAQVTFLADLLVPVAGAHAAEVTRLIDALEEHDDVKEVYTNGDFAD